MFGVRLAQQVTDLPGSAIPLRNHRHARGSGHPGRAGTAFAALGPRFRGGDGKKRSWEPSVWFISLAHGLGDQAVGWLAVVIVMRASSSAGAAKRPSAIVDDECFCRCNSIQRVDASTGRVA